MKNELEQYLPQNRTGLILIVLLMLLSFFVGWMSTSRENSENAHEHAAEEAITKFWTCSMHPQIQQPKPGKCPICGMDLIPVTDEPTEEGAAPQLKLSENARKLASVAVATVQRQFVTRKIRMVGKIGYDETRVSDITTWFPGRIDRLFINYTETPIRKGEPVAEIYSPEIISSQTELLQSVKNLQASREKASPELLTLAAQQLDAARERLRLWGLNEQQIKQMEQAQHPTERITVYSAVNGIIVEKKVQEGMYVKTGSKLFQVANLRKVWLELDAYESDLVWLRKGQKVQFSVEAFPGKQFEGKIAYIHPTLDNQTRTVKVRVNVGNRDLLLKPGMLASANIESEIGANESVIVNESGYSSTEKLAPLVIPASAPLITGKRAIVYLETSPGVYEGREIVLGPRAGDFYLVKSGLAEGERIVVKGNFKIDSAIQILAKPSMMSPEGAGAPGHQHGNHAGEKQASSESAEKISLEKLPENFRVSLDQLYLDYFELQFALSHDQFEVSLEKAGNFLSTLSKIPMNSLPEKVHQSWMSSAKKMEKSAQKLNGAETIEVARTAFEPLSNEMIRVAKTFRSEKHQLLVFHCPMAFDYKGADWLQNKEGTENPYFGSSMFSCGEQTANLTQTKEGAGGQSHE